MKVKHYERNQQGRDLIVGDVHGNFTKLREALKAIRFDESKDRLFSVGDLVDLGPESEQVLEWLEYPWFHPVQGNHEDMAIRWPNGRMDAGNYLQNGGGWNISNPESLQLEISESLRVLPIGIELETENGLVAIIHAEVPGDDWGAFREAMNGGYSKSAKDRLEAEALWARHRITYNLTEPVQGVYAVVVGHTPVDQKTVLGNVHYIDTGGWFPAKYGKRELTILDAATLEAAQ